MNKYYFKVFGIQKKTNKNGYNQDFNVHGVGNNRIRYLGDNFIENRKKFTLFK